MGLFIKILQEDIRFQFKRDHPLTMVDMIKRAFMSEEEQLYLLKKVAPTTTARSDRAKTFYTPSVTSTTKGDTAGN